LYVSAGLTTLRAVGTIEAMRKSIVFLVGLLFFLLSVGSARAILPLESRVASRAAEVQQRIETRQTDIQNRVELRREQVATRSSQKAG